MIEHDDAGESGEFPKIDIDAGVFDGSEDEDERPVEGVDMRVHDLYFDLSGEKLDPETWHKIYPDGRVRIAREGVLGLALSTEFVGINHNPDPLGVPWIFETIVHVDGDVVYSEWSSTREQAEYAHTWARWRTWVGGALVWRLGAWRRRVRHELRKRVQS